MKREQIGHVVVVGTEDPWASTTGGTVRTRALIDAISTAGADVTLVHPPVRAPDITPTVPTRVANAGFAALSHLKRELLPLPTMAGARDRTISAKIDRLASTADLMIATTLSTAPYWRGLQHARLWMEYSDLWSEFAARESQHRRGVLRWTAGLQSQHFNRLESQYNSAASVVTAAGFSDRNLLLGRGTTATWLPTPIKTAPDEEIGTRPPGNRTAGFIGNFEFHPNRDALEVLVTTWGPELIRRGWRVGVAGRASDGLSLPDWIIRLGSPDSVSEFYEQIDLALAPIRLGGGMKVKVVEALLHGRPVVASEFAMAGFPDDLRELVTVVDVAAPTFPSPDDIPRTASHAHPALAPFTGASFERSVAELLTVAAEL